MNKNTCDTCGQVKQKKYFASGKHKFSYKLVCDCNGAGRFKSYNRVFKLACLDYLGSRSCFMCGYNRCIQALEFHHRDATTKLCNISKMGTRTLTDVVKKELDKCVVLCVRCHREIEYGCENTTENTNVADFTNTTAKA